MWSAARPPYSTSDTVVKPAARIVTNAAQVGTSVAAAAGSAVTSTIGAPLHPLRCKYPAEVQYWILPSRNIPTTVHERRLWCRDVSSAWPSLDRLRLLQGP